MLVFGLWRSLVSVLDWGSRGPGFKSRQPDQITVSQTFQRSTSRAARIMKWSPDLGQLSKLWAPRRLELSQ